MVLILMTLVFMFWLYQRDLSSTVESSTAANTAVRVETPAATAANNPTSSAAVVPSTSAAVPQNDLSGNVTNTNLQSQLENERLNLEQLNSSLNELRQTQNLRRQQLQNEYPQQLRTTSSEIRNLTEAQQQLRSTEASIYMQSQSDLQSQMATARLTRDTLDPVIQNLEQQNEVLLREQQTLEGISLRSVTQEARLVELRNQQTQQQTQLALLREQRSAIANSALEQFQVLNGFYRQQQIDLRAEQSALQQELNLRRGQINELQMAEEQLRMSLIPIDQRILQTETALSTQRQRIQQLERQLSVTQPAASEPSSETR